MAYVAPGLSLIRHQRQGDELENWVWPLVRATSLAKSGKRTVDALWLTSTYVLPSLCQASQMSC